MSPLEALETRQLLSSSTIAPLPSPAPAIEVTTVANPSTAPTVGFVQFEPLTGRILVEFSGDSSGYNTATLTDPANYGFRLVQQQTRLPGTDPSRPKAGVVLAPNFAITGVTIATPVAAGMPQAVIVSINNNQPLRDGTYQFVIRSSGTTDLAGRPLDGEYLGVFPSGNGQVGGDFVTNLEVTKHTVLPAKPAASTVIPATTKGIAPGYVYLPTRPVRVRYAAAKPGRFMLAGGNHITLIVLPHQNFPGTYRPPTTRPAVHEGKSK